MKRLIFDLDDLIKVLEALRDHGEVKEIILGEYDGYPSIADVDEPEQLIVLKPDDELGVTEGSDDNVH